MRFLLVAFGIGGAALVICLVAAIIDNRLHYRRWLPNREAGDVEEAPPDAGSSPPTPPAEAR